jgi:uncharacterized protein (DUF427 family)
MPIHAIWNNRTIASTDDYKIVEGRYYFPPTAVIKEYFSKNGNQYVCRWKGTADYYDVTVGSQVLKDAAMVFHETDESVHAIREHFVFSDNISIEKTQYGPKELIR